jgi:hypothetical protein
MPHSFAICSRQLAADSSCIAADNCYPKFTDNQPNLFIICDDLLFPLYESLDHVEGALYGPKGLPMGNPWNRSDYERAMARRVLVHSRLAEFRRRSSQQKPRPFCVVLR